MIYSSMIFLNNNNNNNNDNNNNNNNYFISEEDNIFDTDASLKYGPQLTNIDMLLKK